MRIGGYEVERELARGGMGVVCLARDTAGELVAIKLLLTAEAASPEQISRFRREAEALAALDHPGILRVREHGVEKGRPFVVMDYLAGATLERLVKREGPLPEERARDLAQKLAAALKHAHLRGVVHRDLKPANVILRDDQPVLVDFGLALALDPTASRLTETGTIMGSPNFMAPEQAQGERNLGPAADLYALGATLYFLLTGKPPFEGKSSLAILERVVGQLPRAPRELRPGLSPQLELVVLRCLEKRPSDRYPSAFALEQALAVLKTDEVVATQGGVARGAPTTSTARALVVLAAVFLGALGVLASRGGTQKPVPAEVASASSDLRRADAPSALTAAQRAAVLVDQGRRSGDPAESLAAFNAALELDPDNVEALRARAKCYSLRPNTLDRALRDCERLIALEPTSPQHWVTRATVHVLAQDLVRAHADYSRALELDPEDAEAYYRRGALWATQDRFDEAYADYDRVQALRPQDAAPVLARAEVLAREGRYAEALAACDRTLELDPESGRAHCVRGEAKVQLGRLDAAARDLERAEELGVSTQLLGRAYYELGQRLLVERQFRESFAAFEDSLQADPSAPFSYCGRAEARGQLDDFAGAMRDYDRALELDPSNPSLWALRGDFKAKHGLHEEAVADFDEAISRAPDLSLAYSRRARSRTVLGDQTGALADYERALELKPGQGALHAKRGALLANRGQLGEALAELDRARELGLSAADAAEADRIRAEIVAQLGRQR